MIMWAIGLNGTTAHSSGRDDQRADDHQRHGDLVQATLEVEPAAQDQRQGDGDQRQHNVEMADDRQLQRRLYGEADDILGQERLEALTEQ